jgi:sulfate transport system permease protein
MMRQRRAHSKSLPGFGITFGFTLFYLALIVLIPMSALFFRSLSIDANEFVATLTNPRVQASFRLTFGASLIAAAVNLVFGAVAAWSLTRYEFPGKGLFNALVDLPFAMPTAVSGIALMTIFSPTGLLGSWLFPLGIRTSISPLGVVIALVFIGFPFVVRTLQPAIEDLDREAEMAAASLGASRWQTFLRVTVPSLLPAAVTGFTLAFARALGEYGSVVFIAGNLPMKTEIASLLIISRIDENDIVGASAVAMVLLLLTLAILMLIQGIQWFANRRTGRESA